MIEGFELPWLSEDDYWCRNHKKGRRAGLFSSLYKLQLRLNLRCDVLFWNSTYDFINQLTIFENQ